LTTPKKRVGVADPEDVRRRASDALGQPLADLVPLVGGLSSLTYRAKDQDDLPVVVKVAPPGLAPVRNRDVLRQAGALAALAAAPGVAVPAVLGTDAGDPPEIPPLFVMTFAEGESYEPRHTALPDAERPPADDVRARGTAAAVMLAHLHGVRPDAVGLTEPPVEAAVEVERWQTAFSSVELPPAVAALADRSHEKLVSALPKAVPPAVLHGDWRLGNMQCVGPEIRAVIDWEIWSIGDPRTDLAWMRLMHDRGHPSAAAPDAPSLEPDELLAVYEDARGAGVDELAWFDAFVRYKQASASALLVKNAERRGDVDEATQRMRTGIELLLEDSLRRLG
jgi:aminoglycoside phosphotransferase (APT) family kinase protein